MVSVVQFRPRAPSFAAVARTCWFDQFSGDVPPNLTLTDAEQELINLGLQVVHSARELLCVGTHRTRRGSCRVGGMCGTPDILIHHTGAFRGLLDIPRDLLGRRALLLNRGGYRGNNGIYLGDGLA